MLTGGGGWGVARLDLSLILSPFVYRVWGPRGRPRPCLRSLALSSPERGPRRFLFARAPLSAEPQPPHLPGRKLRGPSRVPSLCLVGDSCLSSRLFQFACHLHTFHFFFTRAKGREWGGGDQRRGALCYFARPTRWTLKCGERAANAAGMGPGQAARRPSPELGDPRRGPAE